MMKKLFVAMLIVMFVFPSFAFAAFENKTQEQIAKELVEFYNETKGNTLSAYAIEGLLLRFNKIFRDNVVMPPMPKPKDIPDDVSDK